MKELNSRKLAISSESSEYDLFDAMIRLAKVRACTNLIILSSNVHTVLCEEKGRFCIPVHWTEFRNESVPFYLRGPQNHRFEGRGIIARRAIAHDRDNYSTIRCFVFLILG